MENESTKEAVLIWHITEVLLKQLHEKSMTLLTTFKGTVFFFIWQFFYIIIN